MKQILKNLTITAMFFALGFVLPFLTGQIPQIGSMLLPMHIPVFLCALICGWQYAVPMSFILPLFRSAIMTMPPMYPTAISMAFELAAYALVTGLLYKLIKNRGIVSVYISLVVGMLAGRAVWGLTRLVMLGISGTEFGIGAFFAGAFTQAFPGIIVQLILIPAIMIALDKTKVVPFKRQQ